LLGNPTTELIEPPGPSAANVGFLSELSALETIIRIQIQIT
jgi:hypothetical protein